MDCLAVAENRKLILEVQAPANKASALDTLLDGLENGQGAVVFCADDGEAQTLAQALKAAGRPCGLAPADAAGPLPHTITVTAAPAPAFTGAGTALAVHYTMPASLGLYLAQLAGSAMSEGRAVVLYAARDVVALRRAQAGLDEAGLDEAKAELSRVVAYCHASTCLRGALLAYLNQEAPAHCGSCSVCRGQYEEHDITDQSRIIFNCVFKMGRLCNYKSVVAVLQGSKSTKLRAQRLHLLPTYGLLADMEEASLQEMLAYLVKQEYLALDRSDGVLSLTGRAQDALLADSSLYMTIRRRAPRAPQAAPREQANPALFTRLKKRRTDLARRAGLPVYSVFTDSSLSDIARIMPESRVQLQKIHGISETSLRRFGDEILSEIKAYIKE